MLAVAKTEAGRQLQLHKRFFFSIQYLGVTLTEEQNIDLKVKYYWRERKEATFCQILAFLAVIVLNGFLKKIKKEELPEGQQELLS